VLSSGKPSFLSNILIMSFRENVRDLLDRNYMEQKELAYQAKIPIRSLEAYLRKDSSMPSADKAVRIARALGVSVEYLVTGHETRHKAAQMPLNPRIRALVQASEQLNETGRDIALELVKSLKTWHGKEGISRG
jgi:transcriptional regulator with XRE-family HTH domain